MVEYFFASFLFYMDINIIQLDKTMIEVVLVLAVIVLIYFIYLNRQKNSAVEMPVIPIVAPTQPATSDVPAAAPSREEAATKENMEYFTTCGGATLPDISRCGTKYAENDYGIPGGNYVDYVMNNTIEPTVVANHKAFIRDRVSGQAENQIITGRTYTPDSHQSYDPIPWMGLLRPRNVPVCNPDQVPDVDFSLYANKRTITW